VSLLTIVAAAALVIIVSLTVMTVYLCTLSSTPTQDLQMDGPYDDSQGPQYNSQNM